MPFDTGLSNISLEMSRQAREIKSKNKQMDYILKIFFIVKQTISKMNRQPLEWGKIFASEIPDKRLISKICKEFTCNAGDLDSSPGLGRSPGGGHGNHSRILPWRISMDRGAWWAPVHGVAKSRT